MKLTLLAVAVCLFAVANATMVKLLVKNGGGSEKMDLCTPFSPMKCRMMCPQGSQGITDGCGKCACIDMNQASCRKMCPAGQRLYPRCNCVTYNDFPAANESFDPCAQAADTGLCRGFFRMFYFNSATGQCEKFVYGGCGGNSNRFSSIEECKAGCM